MNKRDKWDVILIAGLLIAMVISPLAVFGGRCAGVRGQVLRLHIIANSDSAEDQAIKLRVRDALLEELGGQLGGAQSLDEARYIAAENLDRAEEIARRTLSEAGRDDPVCAQTVRMYFDTRDYDGAILPAGEYDALRVTIGEAKGRNWWCVMFPPLCIPAAARQAGEEETKEILLLEEEPNYKLAFWSVEAVERLLDRLEQE